MDGECWDDGRPGFVVGASLADAFRNRGNRTGVGKQRPYKRARPAPDNALRCFERIYSGARRTGGAFARTQDLRSVVREPLKIPQRVGHLA